MQNSKKENNNKEIETIIQIEKFIECFTAKIVCWLLIDIFLNLINNTYLCIDNHFLSLLLFDHAVSWLHYNIFDDIAARPNTTMRQLRRLVAQTTPELAITLACQAQLNPREHFVNILRSYPSDPAVLLIFLLLSCFSVFFTPFVFSHSITPVQRIKSSVYFLLRLGWEVSTA